MAKSFPNTGATVIDATADLPGSPSEGMMVFQKDTNELKIYDGSSWISMLDTDTPTGLVLINSSSLTANVNDITSVFSSTYDFYRIMIRSTASVNETLMYFRFLNGATPITSANYKWASAQMYVGSGFVGGSGNNADTVWPVCQTSTTNYSTAFIDIYGAGTALNKTYSSLNSHHQAGDYIDSRYFIGAFTTGTAYTGFRLWANAGGTTFTGTVKVYGYRNSI